MDKHFSKGFAQEWIDAWNSHDMDRILSHYAEDFVMTSPVIQAIAGVESGSLQGKSAVRAYWEKALAMNPTLHFELIQVFTGVDSLIIHYQGHRGPGAEIFYFNQAGKVFRAGAHYS